MIRLLLCLLCLPFVLHAADPNPTFAPHVRGRVTDPNGLPVQGAVVSLVPHGSQLTGADGRFQFRQVKAGTYELRVTAAGYGALVRNELVVAESDLELGNLPLDFREKAIDEVDINGLAPSWQHLGRMPAVSATAIHAAKKTEVVFLDAGAVNLATNNPRQAYAKVPGINIWEMDAQNQGINVAARGLNPVRSWEFAVRQDGVDITASSIVYGEAYYVAPFELIDRIEVVRGAGSLQFGPQMGGTINYVLRQTPGLKPLEGEVRLTGGSYGFLSGYALVGGKRGKWHWTTGIVRRQHDGWRENSRYFLNQGMAIVNYQATERLKLAFHYTGANTRYQMSGYLTDSMFRADPRQSIRPRDWFGVDWHAPSLHLDWQLPDSLHLNVRVFGQAAQRVRVQSRFTDVRIPDDNGPRVLQGDLYNNIGAEARLRGFYRMGKYRHAYVVGARYFYSSVFRRIGEADPGPGPVDGFVVGTRLPTDIYMPTENASAFAENAFLLGKLSVTVGTRLEHLRTEARGRFNNANAQFPGAQFPRTRFMFGAGAEYHVSRTTSFYANWTQTYRPVTIVSFVPSFNTAVNAFNQVDPDLQDATGYNMDIGYRGRLSDWLQFDIGGYYLWYGNRADAVQLTDRNQYPDPNAYVPGISLLTNIGASRAQGVESFVEFNPVRALGLRTTWGEITLFNSTGYTDAAYRRTRNPVWDYRRLQFAPLWNVRSGISYRREGFRANLMHSYTDKNYTDPANTVTPDPLAIVGVIPAYRVWDFNMAWQFSQRLEFTGAVNNVFNSIYVTRRFVGLIVAEPRIMTAGLTVRW